MVLYIYPGRQIYACSKCSKEVLPKTFQRFRPICEECVFSLGLKCLKHNAVNSNNKVVAIEVQKSIILARELAIIDILKDGPAKTAKIVDFFEERRANILRFLRAMESKGQIISYQHKPLTTIWWAKTDDEKRLSLYMEGDEKRQPQLGLKHAN